MARTARIFLDPCWRELESVTFADCGFQFAVTIGKSPIPPRNDAMPTEALDFDMASWRRRGNTFITCNTFETPGS